MARCSLKESVWLVSRYRIITKQMVSEPSNLVTSVYVMLSMTGETVVVIVGSGTPPKSSPGVFTRVRYLSRLFSFYHSTTLVRPPERTKSRNVTPIYTFLRSSNCPGLLCNLFLTRYFDTACEIPEACSLPAMVPSASNNPRGIDTSEPRTQ